MIAVDPNPYHALHIPQPNRIIEDRNAIRPVVEDRILQRILLDYLIWTVPVYLPGGEGLRDCDVLREYPALSESGIVPPRRELIRRHPELTAAIDRFFISTAGI